jgi:hypothetical protein
VTGQAGDADVEEAAEGEADEDDEDGDERGQVCLRYHCRIWAAEGALMNIEIRDSNLEERIRRQAEATGAGSVEEVLARLLDTQEEQDRWLQEQRNFIKAEIDQGVAELDRGEGIPESQLDAYLAKLKASAE